MSLICYTALDYISEKVNERRIARPPGAAPSSSDPFLGLLFPVEEWKAFGYVSNGNTSIILLVRDVLMREDKVRETFRALHRLYVDTICNPFYGGTGAVSGIPSGPGPAEWGKITSPSFEAGVTAIVDAANAVLEYTGPMPF